MGNRGHALCISYAGWGSVSHYYVQYLMNILNGTKEYPGALARRPSAIFYPRSLPS